MLENPKVQSRMDHPEKQDTGRRETKQKQKNTEKYEFLLGIKRV